ncbi:MAG: HAMP domain-containing histidine kinase [Bacteroidales bacterium]|nr:HAMP domain-containing histidine kinase [Bacteroidales bacterium]
MNKKLIWLLIGIMAIALVSLIMVQTFWIRNAVNVNEQQFSQMVNRSLHLVSQRIERQYATKQMYRNYHRLNQLQSSFPQQIFNGGSQFYFRSSIYSGNKDKKTIGILEAGPNLDSLKSEVFIMDMENSKVKLLDSDKKPSLVNPQTENPDNILLGLNEQTRLAEEFMEDIFFPTTPITRKISQKDLEDFIANEFSEKGINLKYEYALLTFDGKQVYKSKDYKNEVGFDVYKVGLFPNDLFSTPHNLVLYFPKKDSHILRSLGTMGFSSIILVLVIILTFSLTIYIIFKQKRLSEIKNDFVNNMTHELKTPISTISLASQMLKDNTIGSDIKNVDRISQIIEDESKRLTLQVEKVLQMAIFEKGKIKLRIRQIDFHEVVQNVVQNFDIQVKNRDGKIIVETNAKNPIIEADEVHITNVLVNLLDNALKYTEESPEIRIKTENYGKGITFFFRDNGIGIGKDEQKRIFEKFYRVSTGNIHNVKGFGLGLSYVKKIVDVHNGHIKIDSEKNIGTSFEIQIPFKHDNK